MKRIAAGLKTRLRITKTASANSASLFTAIRLSLNHGPEIMVPF